MLKQSELDKWVKYKSKNTILGLVRKALYNVREWAYSLVYGVKNVWQWLPIIYSDEDASEMFLMRVMHFKIGKMLKMHLQYGSYSNEKVCQEMTETYQALGRLIEDKYDDVYMESIKKKYGNLEMYSKDNQLDFSRQNVFTDEDIKECVRMEREAYEHSEKARLKDLETVSKNIMKIDGWWL